MKRAWLAIAIAFPLALLAALAVRLWVEPSLLRMGSLFDPETRVENFRSMERIFPHRWVRASDEPFRFERAERELPVTYDFQGERRTLDDFLERVTGTGLLVIQGDRIVHERYLYGADETTRFTSWSVAKSFVSTLVGIALAEGRLSSLDETVGAIVPELGDSAYADVPVRHVLQMSSGVEFDETYGDQWSDINRYFWKVFLLGRGADDVLRDYRRERASGEAFHYISIDTQALGAVLRNVTGQTLSSYLQEKLWQPLGMERDTFWSLDSRDGDELAFCCLNATLRDFAKLGRLYLRHGNWDGRQIVPESWVLAATTPSAPHLEPDVLSGGLRGYQYQWWVPGKYDREYFAAGVWGQYIYVSEPDDLIVVRTSVDPSFLANYPETIAVFRAIRDHLRTPG